MKTSNLFFLLFFLLVLLMVPGCKSGKKPELQNMKESDQISQDEFVLKSYASLLYYWSELRDKSNPELVKKMRKNVEELNLDKIESGKGQELFLNARNLLFELDSIAGFDFGYKLAESSHELGKIKNFYGITKEDLAIYNDEELTKIMEGIDALMFFGKNGVPSPALSKENSRGEIIDKFVLSFRYWIEISKDKNSDITLRLENELNKLDLRNISDPTGKELFTETKSKLLLLRDLEGYEFGFKSGDASLYVGKIMAHYKITSDDLKKYNDSDMVERRNALESLMRTTGQWPK